MAKAPQKIILSGSRDIPFDRLVLSQSNVRRVKAGVSIGELAADIVRRTLLQSLNVRPILDAAGQETGQFEVPAGGRRFRALELLVKQKRLAKDAPIPCVVKAANDAVSAEEDSFAENTFREQLHPLDQFRAMQAMVDKGEGVEAIAAHFLVTPAVVNQRLRLARVSPTLHDIYAEDGMTLEQLMAFAVSDDHARQEQVWEMLAHSYNKSGAYIRQKLTENSVRAGDKRVRFIGVEAYVAAGGCVMRDLFEPDDGGWLTDPALLDRLVGEKLQAEGETIAAEGWKWVATAVDMPWGVTNGLREIDGVELAMTGEEEERLATLQTEIEELEAEWADAPEVPDEVQARIEAIDAAIGALIERPMTFEAQDMAIAGAFLSIEVDGTLSVERGYVRPEDEPVVEADGETDAGIDGDADYRAGADGDDEEEGVAGPAVSNVVAIGGVGGAASNDDGDEDGEVVKPLPDRLVAELTAWRTLALQDAFAQSPSTAFAAVLHAFVLDCFYSSTRESCLQISLNEASFGFSTTGLRDSAPARAIAERHKRWADRLPDSDKDLWDVLLAFDGNEQAALFAHCASRVLNAQQEVVPKYDNGRISKSSIERRVEHSHVLARAVGLDLVGAGWRPTVAGYLGSVTKQRIIADVAEAKGAKFAEMIDHLKKADMAREAERLLEDGDWLPEPMRTPALVDGLAVDEPTAVEEAEALPAFLDEELDGAGTAADNDDGEALPEAA
ncbi:MULTISPECIES: ParB/RepB/Spo0J family partition protein [Sphingomonadales]|jgi:ParB family chromosome partitioning protein|uniref:ParB/RepB/Spo0J family partition protein n=1 Tax=Sphingomonadales TaxID=204457 RepID=UPI000B3D0F73|nr:MULTISPECIES: ParB/RepB/Spo0J family partition protein [Sphingomonadales]MBA4757618.1 ParB/RepB/Spo0J family partition protein [Sphingosinicella sp.]